MTINDILPAAVSALAVISTALLTWATIRTNERTVATQIASQTESTRAQLASQAELTRAQLTSHAEVTHTQLLADMTARGLGYFSGGSQERSVGIAALRIVENDEAAWRQYRDAIAALFYAQLLYLLEHGRNRWDSHEIANIEMMTDWLIASEAFPALSADRARRLLGAIGQYQKGAANQDRSPAIDGILRQLGDWQTRLQRVTDSPGGS